MLADYTYFISHQMSAPEVNKLEQVSNAGHQMSLAVGLGTGPLEYLWRSDAEVRSPFTERFHVCEGVRPGGSRTVRSVHYG